MITTNQSRAARGLLDWTQQDLADASGLSKTAINNFEKGHSDIKAESLKAIRMAFESADIEFLEEDGLRRKTERASLLKGSHVLANIMEDIANTLKNSNNELLIFNLNQGFLDTVGQKPFEEFIENIMSAKASVRALCNAGTTINLPASCLASIETDKAAMTVFTYGKKTAICLWGYTLAVVAESQDAAKAERLRFETLWAKAKHASSSAKSSAAR